MPHLASKKRFYFFAFALSLAVSGCAVKAEQVNLYSDEMPEVSMCGDALQATLGVAPLLDRRPKEEIAGDKPTGVFLLLWNQRIGDYVSGDKDFTDPVAAAMPRQIAFHLAKTNCFFETKALQSTVSAQPRVEELLVVFSKEKVDYLLVGELNHFYGRQYQKSYGYAIPAYVVGVAGAANNVGSAVGQTEMVFTLYDTRTGEERWRGKVTGESSSAVKGSYPKVARESFLQASQKLANHLYRFVQHLQGSPVIVSPETL